MFSEPVLQASVLSVSDLKPATCTALDKVLYLVAGTCVSGIDGNASGAGVSGGRRVGVNAISARRTAALN